MYIADLHIHSSYSRATSRECTPEHLDLWARRKGINILGTGDFTHPAWREVLSEKLEAAEEGLYTLKKEYMIEDISAGSTMQPRFVVSGEISSIYKKNGKVRKVHSLILLPGLEDAQKLSKKLETIGNIHSDGRPILGLDCRDLLEITLELCPGAIFIPAHIWTPHFSLFGAFSGFDTVEECFEDLTPYIHAMETGLSSDPAMNWRLSALDGYNLVSNSDAHSPAKLGREANLLDIPLSYDGLRGAIQEGRGLAGTIEFFPEEGKYHFDGHRKCHLCLTPSEADAYGGICPVCGRKITIGVSHRVDQLSDREEGFVPDGARPYESIVPLPEVIAASTGRPSASTRVTQQYMEILRKLGPEFYILREAPIEDIRRASGHLISEGVHRLREGRVLLSPGFDGEYGKVSIFKQSEIDGLEGQLSLFPDMQQETAATMELPPGREKAPGREKTADRAGGKEKAADRAGAGEKAEDRRKKCGAEEETEGREACLADGKEPCCPEERAEGRRQCAVEEEAGCRKTAQNAGSVSTPGLLDSLNEEQRTAVVTAASAVAVIAGPGTGKTKTLITRLLYLLKERGVSPTEITAVTFTKKAAQEMKDRLNDAMGSRRASRAMNIGTFHSICSEFLKNQGLDFKLADEMEALELAEEAVKECGIKISPKKFLGLVSLMKTEYRHTAKYRPAAEYSHAAEYSQTAEYRPAAEAETSVDAGVEAAFVCYQKKLKDQRILDFDDLLIETIRIMKENAKDKKMHRGFSYLLVDEFQDINPIQFELIREWNRGGRELFVIGDPDQSIYGFRGSDSKCFERLSEDYENLVSVSLRQNYRSTPAIIRSASAVISVNPGEERVLEPFSTEGDPVRIIKAQSDLSEAIFAAKEINRLIGGIDMLDTQSHMEKGDRSGRQVRSFSDIALLYRTHHQAELLEKCLQREGIPYVVAGRDDFLSEKTVRGTVSFFRAITDKEDALAKKTAVKLLWGLGDNEISDSIFNTMAEKYRPKMKKGKPQKILESWMEDMELSEDKALDKLAGMSVFYKNMEEFLEDLSFAGEGDLKRCQGRHYDSDTVTLMTLHGSKGLEFPAVLICGVKKGMIPLENEKHPADMGEERRLFYVGMTRAKEELILLTQEDTSVFLADIPLEYAVREDASQQKVKKDMEQLSLFDLF